MKSEWRKKEKKRKGKKIRWPNVGTRVGGRVRGRESRHGRARDPGLVKTVCYYGRCCYRQWMRTRDGSDMGVLMMWTGPVKGSITGDPKRPDTLVVQFAAGLGCWKEAGTYNGWTQTARPKKHENKEEKKSSIPWCGMKTISILREVT
jgi:hypothetical protein